MRWSRIASLFALMTLLAPLAAADGIGDRYKAGSWSLGPNSQVGSSNVVDPIDLFGGDYISPRESNAQFETGFGGHFSYFYKDNTAVWLGGGSGMYKETDKPKTGAPGAPEIKYSQNSWHLEAGLSKHWQLGGNTGLFIEPGLQYWSGKNKYEDGTTTIKGPTVTRYGLTGRVGSEIELWRGLGLYGYTGLNCGWASGKDQGAKTSFNTGGFEGGAGFEYLYSKPR